MHASILITLCLAMAARAAEGALPTDSPAAPEAAPELALTWQSPIGCPSSTEVQSQFERLLGGPARGASGKHIAASATVLPSLAGQWVLELATVLDGAAGHRILSGDSCASVASAAALILALMIDPSAAERASSADALPATRPTPPAPPAPHLQPPPSVSTVSAAEPPRAPRPFVPFARAFVGGVGALLPTPAPAAGLALGARRGRIGAELSIIATEERRAAAADRAGAGGDFRLVAGGARACFDLGKRIVLWQGCLGAEIERLAGTGFGVEVSRSRSVTMLAGTSGLLVAVPLGSRVALSLDLDVAVRLYHPEFVLDSVGRVFQIPLASGFGALGIVVTI